ncbi:RNA-binding domain-containing protein [Apiospora aurea]|uniref:RNA-binding domain-containing protein n=1 Tax=Apiospora aurea TaxID=335848 RepID=A0ABR1QMD0_9PEZI
MNQFIDPDNITIVDGGLSGYATEEELRSFFQGFGEITYVKIHLSEMDATDLSICMTAKASSWPSSMDWTPYLETFETLNFNAIKRESSSVSAATSSPKNNARSLDVRGAPGPSVVSGSSSHETLAPGPALGEGEGKGYLEISDGLAVKVFGVSHGHCIERHSHRADTPNQAEDNPPSVWFPTEQGNKKEKKPRADGINYHGGYPFEGTLTADGKSLASPAKR